MVSVRKPPTITRIDIQEINHALSRIIRQSESEKTILEEDVASLRGQVNDLASVPVTVTQSTGEGEKGDPGNDGAPGPTGATGEKGDTGPAGIDGAGSAGTIIATSAIGGQRVIVSDVSGQAIHGDNTNLAHLGKVLGISRAAASAGASVDYVSSGEFEDGSLTFTPEDIIYLGANGLMTQAVPTSGFFQIIGHAITATKLLVNIQLPIQL